MPIAAIFIAAVVLAPILLSDCVSQPDDDLPPTPLPNSELPGAEVFQHDRFYTYHIEISPANLSHLEEYGNDEEYLPATLSVDDGEQTWNLGTVGFRHKGAWSLHHCWDENGEVRSYEDECARLSYKIQFNEYDRNNRFFGLKRLNLQTGDFYLLSNILALSIFADAGIPTSRFAPATLYINGELSGLFLALEEVDGRFTAFRHPETGDGNLYK